MTAEEEANQGAQFSSLGMASVIRKDDTGRLHAIDPVSYLFEKRTVMLLGPISEVTAFFLVHELMVLDDQSDKPITILIDSPGGSGEAGMAIYDCMKSLRSRVHTKCIGSASSMAAILLAAGDERSATPNARIMVHNLASVIGGKWADMKVQYKETAIMEENMRNLMSFHTGHSPEEYEQAIDRDHFMSSEEAVEFGAIDFVDYGVQNARSQREKTSGFRGYFPGKKGFSEAATRRLAAEAAKTSAPEAAATGKAGWTAEAATPGEGSSLN